MKIDDALTMTTEERQRLLADVREAHKRCFELLEQAGAHGAVIVSLKLDPDTGQVASCVQGVKFNEAPPEVDEQAVITTAAAAFLNSVKGLEESGSGTPSSSKTN